MDRNTDIAALVRDLKSRVPVDAAELLAKETPERISAALEMLPPDFAARIAEQMSGASRGDDAEVRQAEFIADLMEPVHGVLPADTTVAQAIEFLRSEDTPTELITYLYVADGNDCMLGLVVMRDLIVTPPQTPLSAIMIKDPFHVTPQMKIGDAVKLAVKRHYPVYPVCDGNGRIIGIVRSWKLFERQAIEISAQSGSMVGVNKEERLATPVAAAFAQRHPWLQVNLLTAFLDVFVVGMFSGTIEKIVALAAFLPLLAGQAGNTGCQALAITLRGMTLGDADGYPKQRMFYKELTLGLLNGVFTGLIAAGAMYWYASPSPDAFRLALTIWLAMVGGCVVAGTAGVGIPLLLKRFGADPVTASAIFLTTCTDIAGMGLMLLLATVIVL